MLRYLLDLLTGRPMDMMCFYSLTLLSRPRGVGTDIGLAFGSSLDRIDATLGGLKEKRFKHLLFTGRNDEWPGALDYAQLALERGFSSEDFSVFPECNNTLEEAFAAIGFCRKHGYESITIITHETHIPRAFLTLLHQRNLSCPNLRIEILPIHHPTFYGLPLSKCCLQIRIEAAKIARYQIKGDIASCKEFIEYISQTCKGTSLYPYGVGG